MINNKATIPTNDTVMEIGLIMYKIGTILEDWQYSRINSYSAIEKLASIGVANPDNEVINVVVRVLIKEIIDA